jgi:hypothetical protein
VPSAAAATSASAATPARWSGSRIGAGLVALAVIVFVGAQIGSRGSGADAPADRIPLAPQTVGSAPDITSMTPRERASRLYDRIMRLHEERKADSVTFFAPMALASYASITDMDADTRYDMARVAMVAGALPVAKAQADTILRADSTHLLGLLLAADVARAGNDRVKASRLEATFVSAAPRERARNLAEYAAHSAEIDAALTRLGAAARR